MSMTQLVLGCALGFIVAQGLLYGLRRLFGGKARAAAPRPTRSPCRCPMCAPSSAMPRRCSPAPPSCCSGPGRCRTTCPRSRARGGRGEVPDPVVAPRHRQPASEPSAAAAPADAEAPPQTASPIRTRTRTSASRIMRAARASRTSSCSVPNRRRARSCWRSCASTRSARSTTARPPTTRRSTSRRASMCGASPPGRPSTFPVENYQGATLPQCQQIQSAIDPARMNLKSAVAQSEHP